MAKEPELLSQEEIDRAIRGAEQGKSQPAPDSKDEDD